MGQQLTQPHRYLAGTEMEYGLMPYYSDGTDFTNSMSHPYTKEALTKMAVYPPLPTKGGYTTNGARVYPDIGDKLEYCTPECASAADTVHALIAGEQLVMDAVKRVTQSREEVKNIQVLGRVADDSGMTWGHHESYTVTRNAFSKIEEHTGDSPLRRVMLSHFATRTIFTGGGLLKSSKEGKPQVFPAQKIPLLQKDVTMGTTNHDKGLYNTRDEAHADDNRWARLHVTNGDYNISPWASWLKLGTTSILAYLTDVGYIHNQGSPSLPEGGALKAAQGVGRYANYSFLMANGDVTQAVDVQEQLCSIAQKFQAAYPDLLTAEDLLIIDHWQIAIDDYRKDPSRLLYRVDWITRKHILEQYAHKRKSSTYPELRAVEKIWDNLNPELGIGVRLRHVTQMPGYSEAKIEQLKVVPPKGTRAELRGRIIRDYAVGNGLVVEWDNIYLKGPKSNVRIKMPSPYQNRLTPHSEALLSPIATRAS